MDRAPSGRIPAASVIAAAIGLLAVGSVAEAEPPDLELNPVSRYVESVDIATESSDRVRHVEDPGQGGSSTSALISEAAAENPRIAIESDGDSWVVWWYDDATDGVYYAVRDYSTGDWSEEALVSGSSVGSRKPRILHDSSAAYVAYEADDAGDPAVVVTIIVDDPEPFDRHVIATTTFTGNLDVLLHSESGHVWVTWVDSATDVGWSEWNSSSELWAQPDYESYAGTSVKEALEEIRKEILEL